MIRPAAFVVAWLTLCAVIGYSAYQTNQLVQANRAAIEATQLQTCGTWLSVFILANEGIAPQLTAQQGQRLRARLAADFRVRCSQYVQVFP